MQHPVADDQVKRLIAKRRTEKILLHERRVLDVAPVAEPLSQPQRIQTEIRSEDCAIPPHTQEFTELPRATAALEHLPSTRDLLVQKPGKDALPRFLGQALFGIKIVVVGEGVFFVEYFHHIRNVVRLIHGIMRVEEKRNTIVGLVDRATIPAGQCLIPGNQRAATVWTAQNIEVLCQEFLHSKSHVRRLRSILDPRKSSQGATARSLSCFDRLALAPAT